MNKTIFIAAMFAVAAILGVGLTVLPSTVQEAQAQPGSDAQSFCTAETNNDGEVKINCDFEGIGSIERNND